VVAAGRGHKWLPHFCESTPETVWGYYGLTPEQAARGGLNPKMFNSFLDGSKPAIESTAVPTPPAWRCRATACSTRRPASRTSLRHAPRSEGGVLEQGHGRGDLVAGSRRPQDPYDIRMGVWVTVEAETDYIKNCFEEYNAHTDPSGRYFTLYKRWHLIGLEVGVSVASVALRGEATGVARAGTPTWWPPPSATCARRDARRRRRLHRLGQAAAGRVARLGGLPLGLAHNVKVVRPVKKGQCLSWADVAMDTTPWHAYRIRRDGKPVRRTC
jgi:predicted homoserine dehydrogenase-like protein